MIVNTNTRGLFLIVLILFFQSCFIHETKSKVEEVAFNGMTRTFESEYASFSPEDILGLYVVNRPEASVPGTLKPAGNLFDNLRLRLDGETMKPLNPAFYPAGIHRVDLYSYGPYVSEGLAEGNVLSFSVRREQSTPEALKQSDLLWGRLLEVETSQRRPPQVIFEHQLSKIRISLKAGIGVTLPFSHCLNRGYKTLRSIEPGRRRARRSNRNDYSGYSFAFCWRKRISGYCYSSDSGNVKPIGLP